MAVAFDSVSEVVPAAASPVEWDHVSAGVLSCLVVGISYSGSVDYDGTPDKVLSLTVGGKAAQRMAPRARSSGDNAIGGEIWGVEVPGGGTLHCVATLLDSQIDVIECIAIGLTGGHLFPGYAFETNATGASPIAMASPAGVYVVDFAAQISNTGSGGFTSSNTRREHSQHGGATEALTSAMGTAPAGASLGYASTNTGAMILLAVGILDGWPASGAVHTLARVRGPLRLDYEDDPALAGAAPALVVPSQASVKAYVDAALAANASADQDYADAAAASALAAAGLHADAVAAAAETAAKAYADGIVAASAAALSTDIDAVQAALDDVVGWPFAHYQNANTQNISDTLLSFVELNTQVADNAGLAVASTRAVTGTVATTNASAAVVGTGTSFTTELRVGDKIRIGAVPMVRWVSAIADNTHLTLATNADATVSGAAVVVAVARFTALEAGTYEIGVGLNWASNVTGIRRFRVIKNAPAPTGTGTVVFAQHQTPVNSVMFVGGVSLPVVLAVNDFVELNVDQTSGGLLNLGIAGTGQQMSVRRIR